MWLVRGKRSDGGKGKRITRTRLTLKLDAGGGASPKKEQWLITTTLKEDLPPQFVELAGPHRLPPLSVSMALLLDLAPGNVSGLFATLPLPIATSLPVHLHAPWILSSDRRSIHYVTADASGERPLESVYNEYLLGKLIPPLYFDTLAHMTSDCECDVYLYWPTKIADNITRAVVKGFYDLFSTTEHLVCWTVTEQWIAPKNAIFHNMECPAGSLLADLEIPEFVLKLPNFDWSLVAWNDLRTDTPDELAQLLQDYSSDVRRTLSPKKDEDGLLKSSEYSSILVYLINGEQSLVDIPLLQLGDRKVVSFRTSNKPFVFITNLLEIGQIFGKNHVVGPAVARDKIVIDYLVQADTNVRKLEKDGIRQLLAHCKAKVESGSIADRRDTAKWYKEVLNFLRSLDCIEWSDVDDLPLIPTTTGKRVVSVGHAQTSEVLWASDLSRSKCPTVALIKLGLIIVDDDDLTFLPRPSGDHNQVVSAVLAAIRSVSGGLGRLTRPVEVAGWSELASWLKTTFIMSDLNDAEVSTLNRLPLFPAQCGAETASPSLWAARDLKMLPVALTDTDFNLVKQYLPPATAFTPFSTAASAIFRRCQRNAYELTPETFLALLSIPPTVPESDDSNYRCLLQLFVSWHDKPFRAPLIPDANRIIRRPSDLYDQRVIVFRKAFEGRPVFVHQSFRPNDGFCDGLVTLGVRKAIRSEELMACATALHEDAENGVITRRATPLWNYFNSNEAPAVIQHIAFYQISDLRFIPRNPEPHPHFSGFATELPLVVSPNQVALRKELPVVWTQRAGFITEPSRFLITHMPSFGKPTAEEVVSDSNQIFDRYLTLMFQVAHLVVLATEIAPVHPSDRHLLGYVKATYKWLSNDLEEVEPYLQSQSHLALWLNVQDPESTDEPWTWRAADQLVFDMSFDGEGGRYDVKSFLSGFQPLLSIAGAKAFVHAQIDEPPESDIQPLHIERLREGWTRLRENEHFFDIQFNVAGEVIKAHRGMLAAVVEHFMTALTGDFLEKSITTSSDGCPVYPLHADVSAFAVRSVIGMPVLHFLHIVLLTPF